jgi:hypothetical protein
MDDEVAANLDFHGGRVLVEDRLVALDVIADPARIDDQRRARHNPAGVSGGAQVSRSSIGTRRASSQPPSRSSTNTVIEKQSARTVSRLTGRENSTQ